MSQRVTATGFPTVLARLGVRGPTLPFDLDPVVRPVSVVDLDVPLTVSSPVVAGASSEGELAAPADAALLADTGAQAAGNYFALVLLGHNDTNGQTYRLQRRDAANAASIWGQLIGTVVGPRYERLLFERIRLEQGERLRVVKLGAATALTTHQATIWLVST